MTSLRRLGVEREYRPGSGIGDSDQLEYYISSRPTDFKGPEEKERHYRRLVDAISTDATKKKGLPYLTLSAKKEDVPNIRLAIDELLEKAENHRDKREDFGWVPRFYKGLIVAGTIAGGLAGLTFGYNQMTKWATDVAESMNHASYLLAPITGLAQTGISLVGTAASTIVGGIAGLLVPMIGVASPYVMAKTPLANRVQRYRDFDRALTELEQRPAPTTNPIGHGFT